MSETNLLYHPFCNPAMLETGNWKLETGNDKNDANQARTTKFILGLVLLTLIAFGTVFPRFAQADSSSDIETVIRSVPLYGTNGLTVDHDDHLVIASIGMSAVLVMDTDTGKILKKYTGPGITSPDDVAVAKDGSIYFTDVYSGRVGRISPEGEISTVVTLDPWVNALAISPDGDKLFVSHVLGNDKFTMVDLTGKAKPKVLAKDIGWSNSMVFGSDGHLYAPFNLKNKVVRWNTDTGEYKEIFKTRTLPSSVEVDSKGRLVVTEFLTGSLIRYDMKSGELTVLAENLPTGLDNSAIDSKGRIFVASNHHGGIVEVLEGGKTRELSPPGFMTPSSVAILPTKDGDKLVASDYFGITFFDTKSFKKERILSTEFYPFVKNLTSEGDTVNLSVPIAVDVDVDGGNLIIASWMSDIVQVYNLKERRVTRMIEGNSPLYAIKLRDDLIVSELKTKSVVSISPDGKRTTLASGITIPTGIASKEGDLWVADWSEGKILKIMSKGKVLDKPMVLAKDLSKPEGIAIDSDGSLLVVESGAGRLVRIDTTSGKTTVLAKDLKTGIKGTPGGSPTNYFSGVAIGSDGTIYVSSDKGNEIVRLKK